MANRRTLHKKISLCEQLAEVSDLAKLAYTWGILHADDWGVIKASPRVFKAEVLPLHDAPADEVGRALDELVRVRIVVRYAVDGTVFMWWPTFDAHQSGLHKRTVANRLPMPADADPGSVENEDLCARETPADAGNFSEAAGSGGNGTEAAGNSPLKEVKRSTTLTGSARPRVGAREASARAAARATRDGNGKRRTANGDDTAPPQAPPTEPEGAREPSGTCYDEPIDPQVLWIVAAIKPRSADPEEKARYDEARAAFCRGDPGPVNGYEFPPRDRFAPPPKGDKAA